MKKTVLVILDICLVAVIVALSFYLIAQRNKIFAQTFIGFNSKDPDLKITQIIQPVKRIKLAEQEIRGLYLTSYSAASPKKVDEIIKFMKGSALNAVVIDIKDYSGEISYHSQVPLAVELNTWRNTIKDLPGVIQKFHDNGIYVIARQQVFEDPQLSSKKPEWAVHNSVTGGVWHDNKGLGWMDATQEGVWKYNADIAKEAIGLGFDEVNFDYVRFPSDGRMFLMKFAEMNGRTKAQVIAGFFKYVSEYLKDEPAYLSADLFGLTTERTDDMNIGQQIEDAALYFDYVCPMVYPSHYPTGYMNFKNPADYPYDVVFHALTKGEESLAVVKNVRAKIRPWLQDFNLGAFYTPAMVDAQIKAGLDAKTFGYLLWNARNVYTYAPKPVRMSEIK